jgi:hypothetical protein
MTGSQQQIIMIYVLFWISRIRRVVRRVKQPHLRGTGWSFDVPVEAEFYEGPA